MSKFAIEGYMEVPEEDLAAVLSELPNHASLTRDEPGCIEFEAGQRPGEPHVLDVSELYESREAFELHKSRIQGSKWAEVTKNVSRHYRVEEIES